MEQLLLGLVVILLLVITKILWKISRYISKKEVHLDRELVSAESDEDDDPLLNEAREAVIRDRKASASLLQRRLRVGYARAARLLDLLEEEGVIGPGDGANSREVYGKID